MSTMDINSGGGGKLATRITGIVTPAIVATRAAMAGHNRNLAASVLDDFFDKVSGEVRHTTGDLYATMADHPATPPELRQLFHFMARGNGQWQSILGGTLTGATVSGAIGSIITDLLAPMSYAIISGQPNLILSVSDVAAAKARGIAIGLDHEGEAAQAGYNSDRFNGLVELNYRRPEVNQIWDATNRGLFSEEGGRGALRQLGFREGDLDALMALRKVLIDPARLADLVTFGVLSEEDATPMAVAAGITADDFHLLVLGNGTPPSNEELAFAFRRGIIDHDRFIRGLTQGSLRNEWIPFVDKMVLVPMSTADAVETVVQGAQTDEQGREIARQNGLQPEHWDPLVSIAGNPPGVQQMVSYWHRGKMTKAELDQGIRESRLKNKYIQMVIDGSETLPPERTIVSLVSKGSLTEDQGLDLLLKRGYAPDIAAALMSNAHATKTVTARTLTYTMVTDLYEDQAMPRDQAVTILQGLGFVEEDAGWILDLADINRTNKYRQAAITKVGSSYTKGLTDKNTANLDLLQLGLPQPQIDLILSYWDLEIGTVTKTLTEAQVVSAAKKGFIQPDEAVSRLKGMGYGDADVAILLAGIAPPPGTDTGTTGATT